MKLEKEVMLLLKLPLINKLKKDTLAKFTKSKKFVKFYFKINLIIFKIFFIFIFIRYTLSDPNKMKNVKREISLLKRLDHPNIIKLPWAV